MHNKFFRLNIYHNKVLQVVTTDAAKEAC